MHLLQEGGVLRPYTIINAVGTLDGRGAVDGKSTPIGSEVDHRLMRNIRACVDAVLVGAGTLRSENLTLTVGDALAKRRKSFGLKEEPLSVILTGSGHIPADRRIFRAGKESVLVFAGAETNPENVAELSELATVRVLASNNGFPDPVKVLETLTIEFGVRRLLVEGGPSVNRSFIEGRLVDEVFLTLAPKIAGGDARSLIEGAPLPSEKVSPSLTSIHLSDSEIYLRYRLHYHPQEP